jgi:hypothetical protein
MLLADDRRRGRVDVRETGAVYDLSAVRRHVRTRRRCGPREGRVDRLGLGSPVVGDREKPGAERIAILGLVQVTTAEPVSYAKSRPCFERGMARDAVASATRDAGDIRCEAGIAPVFSWSPNN